MHVEGWNIYIDSGSCLRLFYLVEYGISEVGLVINVDGPVNTGKNFSQLPSPPISLFYTNQ